MIKLDPYEVLGIERDADQETIKRSYRKKAKRAHPDGGGSTEEFNRLHLSWKILSNPKHRKKYDSTGNIEDEADNRAAMMLSIFVELFDKALNEAVNRGNAFQHDIVGIMHRIGSSNISELKRKKLHFEHTKSNLENLRSRFTRIKKGTNHIDVIISKRLEEMERMLQGVIEQIELYKATLELVKEYRFRMDDIWSDSNEMIKMITIVTTTT